MKRLLGLCVFLGFLSIVAAQEARPAQVHTRTIYLIRHGQYDARPDAGPDGPGLSPLGMAQAKLIAARLRGMPVKFTSLTASTMTRAKETALFVGHAVPELKLQTDALLRETSPRAYLLKGEKPEDMAAAEKQLDQAFARYFVPAKDRDESDILVCHGNVIRYLVTKSLGVDTQSWLNLSVAHCSLTIVQVQPDGVFKVQAVGDFGHIPPDLLSGSTTAPIPTLAIPAAAGR